MAMTAAQYLATLSPAEQDAVNKSIAGNPNGLEDWYKAAIAAGDPRAVEASGGLPGSTEAEEGGKIAPWQQAAPASEWMGKRKPTAQELRRWAIETGRSEDYKRYNDAVVSGWIDRNWDVAQGTFLNNYGDRVDKPDERGPKTPPGVNGTGDKGAWGGPGGDAGTPAPGGPATPAPPVPGAGGPEVVDDPLQAALVRAFQGKEGAFSSATAAGAELGQGGIFWTDPTAINNPAIPGPGGKTAPGDKRSVVGPDAFRTGGNMVNPALVSATLTAFDPTSAPSKGGAPAAPRPSAPPPPVPAQPMVTNTKSSWQPQTPTSPLVNTLSNQFGARKPQQWWQS